jgi:hypothetical protein
VERRSKTDRWAEPIGSGAQPGGELGARSGIYIGIVGGATMDVAWSLGSSGTQQLVGKWAEPT